MSFFRSLLGGRPLALALYVYCTRIHTNMPMKGTLPLMLACLAEWDTHCTQAGERIVVMLRSSLLLEGLNVGRRHILHTQLVLHTYFGCSIKKKTKARPSVRRVVSFFG